ncbi:MAG: prepilin peptidase [Acidocella sp.]|nr:prepilin peptidase [Acidocella sp.]
MVVAVLLISATCLLVYAAVHDLAARTVPNWLPVCLVLLGLGVRLADHSLRSGLIVATVTFVALFIIWFSGLMGGGDVKLWAATVLLIPPHWQVEMSFFLRVLLIGGALAVLYLALWLPVSRRRAQTANVPAIVRARAQSLLQRIARAEVWRISRRGPLPYAVAISGSAILTLLPLSMQNLR